MTAKDSNPPRLAIWLLRRALPGNDALTGDLIEQFYEGRTSVWFWRQALIALAMRGLGGAQRHWPDFCYVLAGTAMPAFLGTSLKGMPVALHWWVLSWPWSQVILELSVPALMALAALPALAAGLVIQRTFRWGSLFRTGLVNLTLVILGKYLLDYSLPWLSRPVPGNPYQGYLIIPPVFQVLLFFSTFLIAAWHTPSAGKRAA